MGSHRFRDFLVEVATISASALGGEEPLLCAITVERGRHPATAASSAEQARRLDETQYNLNQGPCLTALREHHTVLIPDLHTTTRWHGYAAAISGEGIRSILAVPVPLDETANAALNCYARSPNVFNPELIELAEAQARKLSPVLRSALGTRPIEGNKEDLHHLLQSRAAVDAAIALIMVQNRCSRTMALTLIHRAGRHNDSRVHEVASRILAQGL
ncbi:GAF and ANTAR domain-containing protein (plasmid) [Arthrobacter sp. D3-18]